MEDKADNGEHAPQHTNNMSLFLTALLSGVWHVLAIFCKSKCALTGLPFLSSSSSCSVSGRSQSASLSALSQLLLASVVPSSDTGFEDFSGEEREILFRGTGDLSSSSSSSLFPGAKENPFVAFALQVRVGLSF